MSAATPESRSAAYAQFTGHLRFLSRPEHKISMDFGESICMNIRLPRLGKSQVFCEVSEDELDERWANMELGIRSPENLPTTTIFFQKMDEVPAKKVKRSSSAEEEPTSEDASSHASSSEGVIAKKKRIQEEDDDDVPISQLIAKKQEEDSDDDLPIAKLIEKRGIKPKEVVKSQKKKEKGTEKAQKSSDKEKSASPKRSEPPRKAKDTVIRSTSDSDNFYETSKGQLVQKLLVRWWFAYEWPRAEDIGQPPAGYEQLDGFLGVFVSTQVKSFLFASNYYSKPSAQADTLGKILDLRDKKQCPSLSNFIKKPSSELKDLCITALENQIKAVRELEGDESIIKDLTKDLREVIDVLFSDYFRFSFSY
jgi:hypothetical protein